ncbi:MAG: hypothetical protein EPN88_13730 [Bacteroidetes bacterium]|nr:MAG: hypothetical protein EPN88_13730 [Bacteroidota bacterium]
MITLNKYREYFIMDDGAIAKNAPLCFHCTQEKFEVCMKNNMGCEEFNKMAKERGWQDDMEGFDY